MIMVQIFPGVNLRNPMMIFWMILLTTMSLGFLWLTTQTSVIGLILILLLLASLTPFFFYYSLTTKVILTANDITKNSIIGRRTIKLSDIKSFGVYEQAGSVGLVIENSEIHKNSWVSQKFIYLADRNNYNPNSFKQKGSIRFHYRKDIYEAIANSLNNEST